MASIYAKVNELLDDFDFDSVHAAMSVKNWRYFTDPDNVPSIETMRGLADRLLWSAVSTMEQDEEKPSTYVMSGGFKAIVSRESEGEMMVELQFIFESRRVY